MTASDEFSRMWVGCVRVYSRLTGHLAEWTFVSLHLPGVLLDVQTATLWPPSDREWPAR